MANKKILLADDSFEIRHILKTRLQSMNYEVVEAENGVDAIEKAVELKPDIIFMDIMMPQKDGMQATLEIKANPLTKDIPIIMLTALSDSDAVLKSYDYGVDYYLNKPFTKEQVMKALSFVENLIEKGI